MARGQLQLPDGPSVLPRSCFAPGIHREQRSRWWFLQGGCREPAVPQLTGVAQGTGTAAVGGGTVRSPLAIRHTWMAAVDVRLDQSRDAPAVQGWG